MDQRCMSAGDGESSVSASQTGISLPADRVAAAMSACFEIEQVAGALQSLIDDRDTCGMVYPVSRGILLRIATLSDCIHTCLHEETDHNSFSDAHIAIYGTRSVL